MTCYEPLTIYRVRGEKKDNGRSIIYFNPPPSLRITDLDKLFVPCGRCEGCRQTSASQWAARLVHEYLSCGEVACFVTLTFNDLNVSPRFHDSKTVLPDYSLEKRTFQLFMKRLRAAYKDLTIRFFHCGEYGDSGKRPHHHAIIFGVDFNADPNKELVRYDNKRNTFLYQSPTLNKFWTFGFASVGSFSFQSANYVSRYCLKKLDYSDGDDYVDDLGNIVKNRFADGRLKPFITESNRPGIGYNFFINHYREIFPLSVDSDGKYSRPLKSLILPDSRKVPIPRYYEKLLERVDPERYDIIKDLKSREIFVPDGFVYDGCAVSLDPVRLAHKRDHKKLLLSRLSRNLDKEL